ncbi:UNVERIFIED_CONTAM: Acetylserotonin O-methyltransferase [Sesamum calycinum]|uniref:Acetylserotonin O-methyltransferase n=1 Tax=Sesamum calycinum TaxID=2727403 RepID=A0AAW2JML0_9LAMI
MFEIVPNADAAFLMSVLHDWGDDECIDILKNCREAIPKDTGKVMIVEAVIDEGEGQVYGRQACLIAKLLVVFLCIFHV